MSSRADSLVARSANVRYLVGVDHLRSLAAVLIIAYHGMQQLRPAGGPSGETFPIVDNPLSALVVEGHTAVALFLVLSGFILTYGIDERSFRYGSFMKNRVLRVVPMYVVVLVIGLYTFPGEYSFSGFLQFFTLQTTPPLSVPAFGPWSVVLWTISVEFTFYLLFPFLLRFLQRYGVRYLLGLLLLANLLRLLSAASNRDSVRDLSYWTILGRIDQFVIGMLAAWLLRRNVIRLGGGRAVAVAAAGFIGVTCALWWFNHHGSFFGNGLWKAQWPLVEALLWAAVVVGYVSASGAWTSEAAKWIAWPGVVSYSVYLLHFPIVSVIKDRSWTVVDNVVVNAGILTVGLLLPAALLLSTLSYLVIERPFMQMRVRYLNPRVESDVAAAD